MFRPYDTVDGSSKENKLLKVSRGVKEVSSLPDVHYFHSVVKSELRVKNECCYYRVFSYVFSLHSSKLLYHYNIGTRCFDWVYNTYSMEANSCGMVLSL